MYVSTMAILYLFPSFHNNGVMIFFIYRNTCIRLQWITFLFRSAHHWRSLLHRQTHCPRISTFLHPDVAHCTMAWAHKGKNNNNTSSSIIIFLPFAGDITLHICYHPRTAWHPDRAECHSHLFFIYFFKKRLLLSYYE